MTILTNNLSSYSVLQSIIVSSRAQWAKESFENWRVFDLSQLLGSMDKDDSAHNHRFFVMQTHKIGVLQVDKPSTPSFSLPFNYYHYLHTLPISSKDLKLPCVIFFTTHTFPLAVLANPFVLIYFLMLKFWC